MTAVDDNHDYVVALVPAKLTSNRIIKKNLTLIAEQQLFLYSVRAGLQAEGVDDVFVSSESQQLLDIAASVGSDTILRPIELTGPTITNQKVIEHAISQITEAKGRRPDLLVLLQPTHPFRFPPDITRAVQIMRDQPDADSVFALGRTDDLTGALKNGRFLPDMPLPRNRKAEPEHYYNTGSVYVLRVSSTIDQGAFFGENIFGFELARQDMEIDIDRPEQMAMAHGLVEYFRGELQEFGLLDRDIA